MLSANLSKPALGWCTRGLHPRRNFKPNYLVSINSSFYVVLRKHRENVTHSGRAEQKAYRVPTICLYPPLHQLTFLPSQGLYHARMPPRQAAVLGHPAIACIHASLVRHTRPSRTHKGSQGKTYVEKYQNGNITTGGPRHVTLCHIHGCPTCHTHILTRTRFVASHRAHLCIV